MKITIIGDGGWGTAIGLLLNGYGHAVTIWGPFADYLEQVKREHVNSRYLKGVTIPESIAWTADPQAAVAGAELVVLASPSKFYSAVCETFKGLIPQDMLVVSLTKGLCETTHCRMSELAERVLGVKRIVVLSGPTHAEEVSRGIPTAIVAASTNEADAKAVQAIFTGPLFRVYTSEDPVGVEIGGAVKNVIAIAVGASDGLGFGDNTRAALITRGLAEITRFALAFGAQPASLAGLSGIGDLIVTCTSQHSRNHFVGEQLGKGVCIDKILAGMTMVAEGVWNAKVIHTLAEKYHVDMPITDIVYKLCYEHYDVRTAVEALMGRSSKRE